MPDLADFAHGPDLAHAAVAQAALDALDALEQQIDRLDRAYLLLLGTGQGMQGVLNLMLAGQTALGQLQQAVTDQATQIADLKARVAALENPTMGGPA